MLITTLSGDCRNHGGSGEVVCGSSGCLPPRCPDSIKEPQLFCQERSTRPYTFCEDIQWNSVSLISLQKLLTFLYLAPWSSECSLGCVAGAQVSTLHRNLLLLPSPPRQTLTAHSQEDKGPEELWEVCFNCRKRGCLGPAWWYLF